MIDLGLPSGTLWACCNVGASKPEEAGGRYQWGETEETSGDPEHIYKWEKFDETGFSWVKYFSGDNKTVLDPEDDVAHVKWGGSWRMPTHDESRELIDNCIFENPEDRDGWILKGINGNSIFFPNGHVAMVPDDECVFFWTSSLPTSGDVDSNSACAFWFDYIGPRYGTTGREFALFIRPVSKK